MKYQFLFAVLSLLFFSVTALAGDRGPMVGGWSPIENINDPYVKEIAEYAVTEFNKRSGSNLKLIKVIKGESQVVAGSNYRLVLTAKDGSKSKTSNYQAIVWEKPWMHFRNLTSFQPVH